MLHHLKLMLDTTSCKTNTGCLTLYHVKQILDAWCYTMSNKCWILDVVTCKINAGCQMLCQVKQMLDAWNNTRWLKHVFLELQRFHTELSHFLFVFSILDQKNLMLVVCTKHNAPFYTFTFAPFTFLDSLHKTLYGNEF